MCVCVLLGVFGVNSRRYNDGAHLGMTAERQDYGVCVVVLAFQLLHCVVVFRVATLADRPALCDVNCSGHVYGSIGYAVPPTQPKRQEGVSWGFRTRVADTFAAVFSESPFAGGAWH